MNKFIKIALITLFVVVVLGSVGANAYFFGFVNLKNYYTQLGFDAAAKTVYQTVKANGSVRVGDIILIQQPQVEKVEK